MQIISSSFRGWRRPLWQITSLAHITEFLKDQWRHFSWGNWNCGYISYEGPVWDLAQVMSFRASGVLFNRELQSVRVDEHRNFCTGFMKRICVSSTHIFYENGYYVWLGTISPTLFYKTINEFLIAARGRNVSVGIKVNILNSLQFWSQSVLLCLWLYGVPKCPAVGRRAKQRPSAKRLWVGAYI